jgi:hypothetical protein
MRRLHEKLAKLTELRGWSQRDLGRMASDILVKQEREAIPQSTMNRMFNGLSVPDAYQGAAFAKVLGVSLDYLADDAQDEPPVSEADDPDWRLLMETSRRIGVVKALNRILNPSGIEPEYPYRGASRGPRS